MIDSRPRDQPVAPGEAESSQERKRACAGGFVGAGRRIRLVDIVLFQNVWAFLGRISK